MHLQKQVHFWFLKKMINWHRLPASPPKSNHKDAPREIKRPMTLRAINTNSYGPLGATAKAKLKAALYFQRDRGVNNQEYRWTKLPPSSPFSSFSPTHEQGNLKRCGSTVNLEVKVNFCHFPKDIT